MRKCRAHKLGIIPGAVAVAVVVGGSTALLGTHTAQAAELIWTGDFETGDFSQYKDKLPGLGSLTKKKLVKSPVKGGRYATELTIFDVASKGKTERAELMTKLPNGGGRIEFKWDGPEYWVGFSFLFKEPAARTSTFFQIHAPNEAKGDRCDFAGNTFTVGGDGAGSNGGWTKDVIIRVIEDGGVSRGNGSGSNNKIVYRYPFPLNEWQDYVVNFRLSTSGDGFYKVWKDGELVYSESGLTNVNYRDSCGNRIPKDQRSHNGVHLGIYGPGVRGFRRIYYDEVRVAQGSDGYALVVPDSDETQMADVPEPETELSVPNPPVLEN